MDRKFFEEQFGEIRARLDGIEKHMDGIEKHMDGIEKHMDGIEKRTDGIEQRLGSVETRLDGVEKRVDTQEKRMDSIEKTIRKMGIEMEAIRADIRLIAEGHVMLTEKFYRFETNYIKHATEMRQDVLNLYKMTYGQLERRVKDLESVKQS